MTTDHEKRVAILEGILAVAWADGSYDERERRLMDDIARAFGAAAMPPALGGMGDKPLSELLETPEERAYVFQQAAKMSYADGVLDPGERDLLDRLAESLGLEADEVGTLEFGAREIMMDD